MFHLSNHDYDNEIPDRRTRAKAPTFWRFMSGLLGNTGVEYPEYVDPKILKIRRMQKHYDRLNAAARGEPAKPSLVAESSRRRSTW
jgi:hypothetical protein